MELDRYPRPLEAMPLHQISQELGTVGLIDRFQREISSLDEPARAQVLSAFELAKELHSEQTRAKGQPYIDHLLRVCLRIKVYFGVDDPDILSAALLHDSLEDQSQKLEALGVGGQTPEDVLSERASPKVLELVSAVTNPEFDVSKDLNGQYREHLETIINGDSPGAILIKLSDFMDNGLGIFYGPEERWQKWATKYIAVVPLLKEGLERGDLGISHEARAHIDRQLSLAESRLSAIINEPDTGLNSY